MDKSIDFDENLAELVGILLGDGSFYVTNANAELDIAFNQKEEDYCKFVENLIGQIINTNITKKREKTRNCIHLRISRRVDTLKLLEVSLSKSGNKIKNQVTIPHWVWNNKNFLRACIRGLIDTDGSIYRLKPHWPNLWQLSFKNNNKRLLKDAHEAFVKLGFHPSKIFGNRFVLTRQKEIDKYFKEIRSNNLKYSPVV